MSSFQQAVEPYITQFLEQEFMGLPFDTRDNYILAKSEFYRKLQPQTAPSRENQLLIHLQLDEAFTRCWRKYCCC